MHLHKTSAVILHSLPYGESDQIVTFYTFDFGKLKGIAKGAKRSRKRFGARLEIGSCVKATFFEKETSDLVRVSDCDLVHSFDGLRQDIRKLAWASYFIELIREMTGERIQNKPLFRLLVAFLRLVDGGVLKDEVQRVFEIRFLSHLGYRPQLDHCTRCRKGHSAERFFFSSSEGGVLCPSCAGSVPGLLPVSLGTIRTLLLAQTIPFEKVGRISFSPQSLKESEAVLSLFLRHYLGKELKSKKFLDQLALPGAACGD
ncbi:MAG TPA: DNA repair protein RecO [Thermodesulfobacteriota bacterium]|nr:DNA repair protein RecO [Thermodesulfobacteriota bacterium]